MSGYSLCLPCMESTWLNQDGQKCFRTYVYRFTILFYLSLLLPKEFKLPCYMYIVKDFANLTRAKKNSVA